tara:strand:- start:132 stop:392 length:261 start_codon:yes stop_codon:yes gene_type:complete
MTSRTAAGLRWDGSPPVKAKYHFSLPERTYKGECLVPAAYLQEGEDLLMSVNHLKDEDREMMEWIMKVEEFSFNPEDLFYWYIDYA